MPLLDDQLEERPPPPREAHEQRFRRALAGPPAAIAAIAGLLGSVALIVLGVTQGVPPLRSAGISLIALTIFGSTGFLIVQPNQACVLILFGRYVGTVTEAGLWWANPLMRRSRRTVSLRVRNLQSEAIKVNDASGNPIEIAEVMLRRQQAQAILAARRTMVQGAVGLVQMALAQLADSDLVELDPERKAAMVSNLMIVLCGDHAPTPVLNTGTLYT